MQATMTWEDYAALYAFFGNSFLSPMSETGAFGLDPAFWDWLSGIDDGAVQEALGAMDAFLSRCAGANAAEAVAACSREHAWLFVGPPEPHVYPWESLALSGGGIAAFGEATREVGQLMRREGVRLSVPNRQAEDHIGIELLFCSVLCGRAADDAEQGGKVAYFMDAHLLNWMGLLAERVANERPCGYYAPLSALALAVVEHHRAAMLEAYPLLVDEGRA